MQYIYLIHKGHRRAVHYLDSYSYEYINFHIYNLRYQKS